MLRTYAHARGLLLLPVAVLLVAGDCEGGSAGSDVYVTWEGTERYAYGYSPSAGDLACDMTWDVAGTPTTVAACPTCRFTFDLDFTYDEGASSNDGTCDDLAVDYGFVYAYVEDPINYPIYAGYTGRIATFYSGYLTVLGYADFNASTGDLVYAWGTVDDYYYSYYTDLHEGEATVE